MGDTLYAIRTLDGKFIYALRRSLADVTSWVQRAVPGAYVSIRPLHTLPLPDFSRKIAVGAHRDRMTDVFMVTEHTLEELLTL
jgi:hypothetical protein